jgi:hypothetical protein
MNKKNIMAVWVLLSAVLSVEVEVKSMAGLGAKDAIAV